MLSSGFPPDKPTDQYLFVYGTLMRGFDNPFARQLATLSTFAGTGRFSGKLYRVSWYPGAVYLPDWPGEVHGEIFLMTDSEQLLPLLDEYEDVLPDSLKSLYLRRVVPVLTEKNEFLSCWVYLYNQPAEGLPEITSGRFTG